MILLAAGEGNLIKGFANVLALYQEAHNQGYRPDMETGFLKIVAETTNSPNKDQFIVGKVRESIGNDKDRTLIDNKTSTTISTLEKVHANHSHLHLDRTIGQ
jgi:hypothetical protein